jgi:hypothetical protein
MCVGKVNKKLWCLVSTCHTWAPSSETRSGVRGRARALGAAGEDGNPWFSPLEDSSQPQSARWCRLAPASWPPEISVRIRDISAILPHAAPPERTCALTRWGRTKCVAAVRNQVSKPRGVVSLFENVTSPQLGGSRDGSSGFRKVRGFRPHWSSVLTDEGCSCCS